MKRQANYHGEIGANGKAYQKGQFIAEQVENKTAKASAKKATKKQEIEPYVWVVAPEANLRSIYSQINSLYNVKTKDKATVETIEFCGYTIEEFEDLVDRYEAGERWI